MLFLKRYHLSVGHDSFSYSSDRKKGYDLKSRLQISGKLKSRCNADLPPPPPPSFLPSLYVFPALEWYAAIQVQQGESWLVSARNASGTQELFQFASLSLERTKIHFFSFFKELKVVKSFISQPFCLISSFVICFVYFERHFVLHFNSLLGYI